MPLSTPASRERIHTRRIHCDGYRRDDGLWDIEGRLTDEKTYPFRNAFRGEIRPGDFIHEMWVRLTVDDGFRVHAVEVSMDHTPFGLCPEIESAFRSLEGVRIRSGWSRTVQERVGGKRGCTHVVKLLDNLAVAAIQTIGPIVHEDTFREGERKPPHVDSCHALRSDGPVVREHYPKWYTGDDD